MTTSFVRLAAGVAGTAAALSLCGAAPGQAADPRERPAGPPLPGKFGCAESVYHLDGYRSESRGFVTLLARYRYRQGVGRIGTYRYNAKTGITRFTGGGLSGSTATGIDGKRSRLFITVRFTDGTTARWACTHV